MNAETLPKARAAARRCADHWQAACENAVRCLRDDLDELLTCWRYPTPEQRKRVRTTNAIERRFREVRQRTLPLGVLQDRTSMDRILFAVMVHQELSLCATLSVAENFFIEAPEHARARPGWRAIYRRAARTALDVVFPGNGVDSRCAD